MNKLFLKAVLALSFVGQVSALPTVAQARAGASNFGGYVSHKATQAGSFVSTPVAKQWNKLSKNVKATVGVVITAGVVIAGRVAWDKRKRFQPRNRHQRLRGEGVRQALDEVEMFGRNGVDNSEPQAIDEIPADGAIEQALVHPNEQARQAGLVGGSVETEMAIADAPVAGLDGRSEVMNPEGKVVGAPTYRCRAELLAQGIVEPESVERDGVAEVAQRAELEGLAGVVVADGRAREAVLDGESGARSVLLSEESCLREKLQVAIAQGRAREAFINEEIDARSVLSGGDSCFREKLQEKLTREKASSAEILSRNCKRGSDFFNSIKLVALDMEKAEADRFRGQVDLIIQDESDSRSSLETDLALSNLLNLARGVRLTGGLCDKPESRFTPEQQVLVAEVTRRGVNFPLNPEIDPRSNRQKRRDRKEMLHSTVGFPSRLDS